jgi:3-oxoadipate enol-lactonase
MPTVDTVLGALFVDDQGKQGNQDQPAALLWPSLFTDHRMWRYQISALQEAGLRTITIDPPGHGHSPGPGRRFTMDECAQAGIQILDAAGVHTPVVLFGDSWGGWVAPRIALRAPERVSGMVLFNTSAERGSWFERMRARVLTKLLAVRALDNVSTSMIVSGLLAPKTRQRQPDMGADLAQQMRTWDRRGFITAIRSCLVDRDAVLDALADINVPTVVVSGTEDTILPAIHAQRIAAHLPGARHVEVSGAAHLVPLEKPEETNSLILEFVSQLPAR